MIERLKHRQQGEEGFTLVELLVVIVILGVLASIVVFAVGGITNKGDSAANSTDTAILQSAQEAQFAQNGVYVNEAGLVSGSFLRTLSSKNDVCLKGTVTAGPPVVTSRTTGTDYKLITPPPSTNTQAQNDALCVTAGGAGFVYAP